MINNLTASLLQHDFMLQPVKRTKYHSYIGTRIIKCPLCQHQGQLPNGDVYELPTNFGLQDAIDSMYEDKSGPSVGQINSLEAREGKKYNRYNVTTCIESTSLTDWQKIYLRPPPSFVGPVR